MKKSQNKRTASTQNNRKDTNIGTYDQSVRTISEADNKTKKTSWKSETPENNRDVSTEEIKNQKDTSKQVKKTHVENQKGMRENNNQTMRSSEDAIIQIRNVDKYFKVGDQDVHVLKNINVDIQTGDFVIIFGASGSGKSTLLHILLGLEEPTNGKMNFLGNDLYDGTTEDYRAEIRKKHIGMVYQQANWVKALSVIENIAFPLQLLGMEKDQAVQRARIALAEFELENWADYYPTELSSGQQQRISMARAIIHNPMVVVADEPTGNLDYENGLKVMNLLEQLNKKEKKTIIMVTHDLDYLAYAQTAVQIFDGEVVGVFKGKDKSKIEREIKKRKQYTSASETNANNARAHLAKATGKNSKNNERDSTAVNGDVVDKPTSGSELNNNAPQQTDTKTNDGTNVSNIINGEDKAEKELAKEATDKKNMTEEKDNARAPRAKSGGLFGKGSAFRSVVSKIKRT